jgi:hypothetical protein
VIKSQAAELSDQNAEKHKVQIRRLRNKMLRVLATCVGGMCIVSFFFLWRRTSDIFMGSYFLGALLGLLNGVIGFLTIEKFIDRTSIVFMKGVFVGMGVRMLVLLGIFILFVKVFGTDIVALVTGLLIFYFTMTVFEVIFLNKRIALKRVSVQDLQR